VVLGVKDGLIRITVTDRDPVLAATIANAYRRVSQTFRSLGNHGGFATARVLSTAVTGGKREPGRGRRGMKHTEHQRGLQIDSQA